MTLSSISLISSNSINRNYKTVNELSDKIAKGREDVKWSNNLFSSILGNSQHIEVKNISNAMQNVMDLKLMLNVRSSSIRNILSNLTEISSLTQNLSANWSEDLKTANEPIINELLNQVKSEIKTSSHNGINLLTGISESSSSNSSNSNVQLVNSTGFISPVIEDGELSTTGLGGSRGREVVFDGKVEEGDSIEFMGVNFKFKIFPEQKTDVAIGNNNTDTAKNFIKTVNSLDGEYKSFTSSFYGERVANKVFLISELGTESANIDISISSKNNAITTPSLDNPLDRVGHLHSLRLTLNGALADGDKININGLEISASLGGHDLSSRKFEIGTDANDQVVKIYRLLDEIKFSGGGDSEQLGNYNFRGRENMLEFTNPSDNKSIKVISSTSSNIALENRFSEQNCLRERLQLIDSISDTNSTITIGGITLTSSGDANNDLDNLKWGSSSAFGNTRATRFMEVIDYWLNQPHTTYGKILNQYEFVRSTPTSNSIYILPKAINTGYINFSGSGLKWFNDNTPDAYVRPESMTFDNIDPNEINGKMKIISISRFATGSADVSEIRGEYGLGSFSTEGSKAAEIVADIGGKLFKGLISHSETLNLTSNVQIPFKSIDNTNNTSEFSIRLSATQPIKTIDTIEIAQQLVDSINADFEKLEFVKNYEIITNNSRGDIIHKNELIGSLNGFRANISTDQIDKLEIKDFKIWFDQSTSEINYQIKINDDLYELKESGISDRPRKSIPAGSILTFKNSINSNFLRISVGSKEVDLTDDLKMKVIAENWKGALGGRFSDSSFVVGADQDDRFALKFNDMSWDKITDGSNIDVTSLENSQISSELIKKVISEFQLEMAQNSSYIKGLDSIYEQLTSNERILSTSVENLIGVDYAKARSQMNQSLGEIQSVSSVLISKRIMLQVINRIIQS